MCTQTVKNLQPKMAGRVLTIKKLGEQSSAEACVQAGNRQQLQKRPRGSGRWGRVRGDGGQRHHRREGAVTAAQPTGDGGPADGNTVGEEGVTVLLAGVFSSLK